MVKVTYKMNAFTFTQLCWTFYDEISGSPLEESLWGNITTYGELNAYTKWMVKQVLERLGLPYSRRLGSFVREILEHPYTLETIMWENNLRQFTLEEALFGEED